MAAWDFEARHCPTLPNEIKKTKLQIYASPQAGSKLLCAPSMSAKVSKIPIFQRVSLTGELVKPVSKSQGGLLRSKH